MGGGGVAIRAGFSPTYDFRHCEILHTICKRRITKSDMHKGISGIMMIITMLGESLVALMIQFGIIAVLVINEIDFSIANTFFVFRLFVSNVVWNEIYI